MSALPHDVPGTGCEEGNRGGGGSAGSAGEQTGAGQKLRFISCRAAFQFNVAGKGGGGCVYFATMTEHSTMSHGGAGAGQTNDPTLLRVGGALGIAGCIIGLAIFVGACAGMEAALSLSPLPVIMG